ncbi:helix-turn-helix domain-containing protein [Alcaligenes aquatilis]|uniref:helix-turn-helix domain-containing protein n=1 Tax=Alcaligenes aquatilis TaxID=323284 RepID=UPI001419BE26|nr:helix-turn-helix domain-containing protein [Alcaligenes aquatilis]QXR36981.1 helix-turn-helix domain-containing protein [Alcaligenes aquatilis]
MTAIQHMAAQLARLQRTPDRNSLVLQLTASGFSQRQIAVEVGVSRSTVFNIVKANRKGGTHE